MGAKGAHNAHAYVLKVASLRKQEEEDVQEASKCKCYSYLYVRLVRCKILMFKISVVCVHQFVSPLIYSCDTGCTNVLSY